MLWTSPHHQQTAQVSFTWRHRARAESASAFHNLCPTLSDRDQQRRHAVYSRILKKRVFLLWIDIPSTCSRCKFGSAATKRTVNAAHFPATQPLCLHRLFGVRMAHVHDQKTLLSDKLKGQLTHLCSACGCCTEGSVGRSLHHQVAANDKSFNKMSQKTCNNTHHQREVWSYEHLIMSPGGKWWWGVSL